MDHQLLKLLTSKKLIINDYIIKVAIEKELTLYEFLVLSFFDNNYNSSFDLELVSNTLGIDLNDTMEAFNSLVLKGLVSLDKSKDIDNRINEIIKLDGTFKIVLDNLEETSNAETKKDIYTKFEQELGRTLSSMDLEIINGWLMTGTSEEIILGALKEAVYNGVTRFNYIDRVIYEWSKKGFKTMKEVDDYKNKRREEISKDKQISKIEQELSDYNWIDEK